MSGLTIPTSNELKNNIINKKQKDEKAKFKFVPVVCPGITKYYDTGTGPVCEFQNAHQVLFDHSCLGY